VVSRFRKGDSAESREIGGDALMAALSELVDFKGGGTPSKAVEEYWGGDIPWASVKDFKSYEINETVDYITDKGLKNSASNLIPKGNLIIPTRMALGKVAINNVDVAINQDLRALIVKDESVVNKRYLFRYMESKARYLESEGKGATVKGITLDVLKPLDVFLPPLNEQKHIAAILDKADSLRRKRQQAIQLADQFLRSVFLDLFGDPVTNPKGWEVKPIGDFSVIVRGSSPRPKGDPRYYGGAIPRLMVRDVTRDGRYVTPKIDSLTEEGAKKSRPIKAETVVMAVSGNPGLTSILKVDACIHDGFIAFNELDTSVIRAEFFMEMMMFLKSTHSSREAGAIFKNLTTTQIKEMEIPLPSLLMQDKYLSISARLQKSQEKINLGSTRGNELFESLSQKAFAGEL